MSILWTKRPTTSISNTQSSPLDMHCISNAHTITISYTSCLQVVTFPPFLLFSTVTISIFHNFAEKWTFTIIFIVVKINDKLHYFMQRVIDMMASIFLVVKSPFKHFQRVENNGKFSRAQVQHWDMMYTTRNHASSMQVFASWLGDSVNHSNKYQILFSLTELFVQ